MQLGVILTPYGRNSPHGWYAEIAQTRGGNGSYLSQTGYPRRDRFFYERGEPGFYYDTQLGETVKPPIVVQVKDWFDRTFRKDASLVQPAAAPMALPRGDGATPSDAELTANYQCYTPVKSGWINTRGQGFVPGTWRFGWNPAGDYGPPTSLHGLGEASASDVLAAMNAHNQRIFKLSVISTAAVSISAMFTLWTRYKRLKTDLARKRSR
jgi:hypothetical protein